MPLYEYECSACKKRFELIQKFSAKPAKVCIHCGGPAVRLLSSPAIQFKGTGWYVTDYAGKSKASEAGKSGSSDSESKPAKKSEPATTSGSAGTASEKPAKP